MIKPAVISPQGSARRITVAAGPRPPMAAGPRGARTGAAPACPPPGRAAPPGPPGAAPRARAWTSALPSAVASTGPAITGRPQASAVSWHSSCVAHPAADHVDDVDRPPGQLLRLVIAGGRPRPGCPGCSGPPRPGRSGRLPRPGRRPRRTGRACPRGQEHRVVGVDHEVSGGSPGRLGQQLAELTARPAAPGPQRLLQQPQAHHVAQVADPCRRRPASLVKLAARGWPRSAPARSSSSPTSDQVPQEM